MKIIQRAIVLFVPFFNFTYGIILAQQPEKQTFFGKIENTEDKTPVSFATIYNKTSKQMVYSDSIGYFNISAKNGDTLLISRIGFHSKELYINDLLFKTQGLTTINLDSRSYDLKTVSISNLGTYEEFKYKVINTPLPESKYEINPEAFRGLNQEPVILQEQASISLGSPVTALYMLLSKEGKSLRKLDKLKEKERETQSYSDKYSPLIVSQLTGLKDLELEKFMKFCNPDINFIMNSTDYDIAAKILDCLKNYNAQKAENKAQTEQ